jgi:thiol-disulfide isomerase/thioredoxin
MWFEITFVLAWVLAAVQGLMIVAFLWVMGRLKQQYDPIFQPLLTSDGPPLRAYVPEVGFRDLRSGEQREVWDYLKDNAAVLLFVTPNCAPCREILASAGRFQREWARPVRFILVMRSGGEKAEQWARTYPEFEIVLDEEGEVARAYRVTRWPFGILVTKSGVVRNKGVVNTPEHLEGLVLGRGKPIEMVSVHSVPDALAGEPMDGSAPQEGPRKTVDRKGARV